MRAKPPRAPRRAESGTSSAPVQSAQQSAADKRGENRTFVVADRIKQALEVMRTELAAPGAVYPYNNGVVSMAEVARRAEVHPTSFYTPSLKVLGGEVRAFVKQMNNPPEQGGKNRKRSLQERLTDWKTLYEEAIQNQGLIELELQQANAERDDALSNMTEMRKECERMKREAEDFRTRLAALSSPNVVHMRPR